MVVICLLRSSLIMSHKSDVLPVSGLESPFLIRIREPCQVHQLLVRSDFIDDLIGVPIAYLGRLDRT